MTMSVRALLLNTLLLAGAVGVALIAAEGLLRVIRPPGAEDVEIQVLNQHDSMLGWRKIPGATDTLATAEYRIIESINSRGIRGPEIAETRPPGARRVLVLGDSFAEGYTVEFADLCSEVLQRELNDGGGPSYQIINAGTAGYSTDQELLYFRSEGVRYRPDVTVLLFYVNDVWFNNQSRYWRGHKPRFTLNDGTLELTNVPVPPAESGAFAFEVEGGTGVTRLVRKADAWLGAHAALYQLVRQGLRNSPLLHSNLIRLGFADVPGEFRPWHTLPDPELDRAWRLTEAILVNLRRESARAGSELVIFHVPPRPAVYSDDWVRTRRMYAMSEEEWSPREDERVLRELCVRHAIDCVFPAERFAREAARLDSVGGRLYFQKDAHWTPEGHRLAGVILAEHLRSHARGHAGPPAR